MLAYPVLLPRRRGGDFLFDKKVADNKKRTIVGFLDEETNDIAAEGGRRHISFGVRPGRHTCQSNLKISESNPLLISEPIFLNVKSVYSSVWWDEPILSDFS